MGPLSCKNKVEVLLFLGGQFSVFFSKVQRNQEPFFWLEPMKVRTNGTSDAESLNPGL